MCFLHIDSYIWYILRRDTWPMLGRGEPQLTFHNHDSNSLPDSAFQHPHYMDFVLWEPLALWMGLCLVFVKTTQALGSPCLLWAKGTLPSPRMLFLTQWLQSAPHPRCSQSQGAQVWSSLRPSRGPFTVRVQFSLKKFSLSHLPRPNFEPWAEGWLSGLWSSLCWERGSLLKTFLIHGLSLSLEYVDTWHSCSKPWDLRGH